MRKTIAAVAASIFLIGRCMAGDPRAADRKPTHIPPQPLAQALSILAKQRQFEVFYRSELVRGLQTEGAAGELTTEEALAQLLRGTRLSYEFLSDNTVTIVSSSGDAVSAKGRANPNAGEDQRGAPDAAGGKEGKKSSSGGFRLGPADRGKTVGADSVEGRGRTEGTYGQLQEVLVTAQKRVERLQDVPVPVTAISAQNLISTNQLRIQDYYTQVPGLSVEPQSSSSFQILSIRGISTGIGNNPTVGVTVDDVPYGSSTYFGGANYVPDIDPADLARIEVLRGPQGTLYGASSMGGLLKFVTVDPSAEAFSGRLQAGTNVVHNGAELGYNVRASVNMPLGDTLAMRVSAFTREDPGYIDNVQTGQNGINEARIHGGRLSLLWRPSDRLALKLSALYQESKGDGMSEADVPTPGYPQTTRLGDLQQSYLPATGAYDRKVQAYSAVLTGKVGSVDLTAISGYSINSFTDSFDYTYALGTCFPGSTACTQAQFGVPGTPFHESNSTDKFSQEIRLSGWIGKTFEWLLGGFYTHERSPYVSDMYAASSNGQIVGQWLDQSGPSTYREYAGFGDLTLHFTNRFDIQLGGRESAIEQGSSASYAGVYDPVFLGVPSPVLFPRIDIHNSAFTYLVTPRLRISPDFMVYARLASGYRAGGPNITPGVPRQFDPDRTLNYEIGAKGDFLGHKLSLDSSLYYIQWKSIQILALNSNYLSYNANGNNAKSEGIELSVESRPAVGLVIAAWVSFNDAVLTESFPANASVVGASGDRLPYASRFSGSLSIQQDFPITEGIAGYLGATESYVGDREGEFASTFNVPPARQYLPGYAKLDLRAGATYDAWDVDLFANNVTDKRGLLSGGLNEFPPFAFNFIQPRTIGINVTKRL